MAGVRPIRILHLSDFHLQQRRQWDSDPVLRGLVTAIQALRDDGLAPDVVAFTGDIAFSGQRRQYTLAQEWIDKHLLTALGANFPREHLLFVPGNHDVDRATVKIAAQATQEALLATSDQEKIADVLQDRSQRSVLLNRHSEYLRFVNGYRSKAAGRLEVPWWSQLLELQGTPVHFAGLCSSWMSWRESDQGNLLVGRYQVNTVMEQPKQAAVSVILVHHPWGWLREFDGTEIERAMHQYPGMRLVLRGHLHRQKSEVVRDPDHAHLELATGSVYAGSDWANAFQLVEIEPEQYLVRVHFRVWHGNQWIPDRNAYQRTRNGIAHFRLQVAGRRQSPSSQDLFALYQTRMSALYEMWDLRHVGVTQPGGAEEPIRLRLDEMYLPLRLAETYSIVDHGRGSILSPEELLEREVPLVIRGVQGTGKTTWMQWTFRQLLHSGQALPIMVELRRLARTWEEAEKSGRPRSLDTYVGQWVENRPPDIRRSPFFRLLKSPPQGIRPVLLLDGWEEVGDLGNDLRDRLTEFRRDYPGVLVVVSSRLYGVALPSQMEGFEELYIQPLADEEVQDLAQRFFELCYRGDPQTANDAVRQFWEAAQSVEGARVLIRTPLLLTMMLLISRSRPLPDKRHKLYLVCVENLLNDLPRRRQEEGVRLPEGYHCPLDSEARMRVVAHLAYQVHEGWVQQSLTRGIDQPQEVLTTFLPQDWNTRDREHFLRWLAGPAGLFIERDDHSFTFTHLSFQEYLAAWHLNTMVEGAQERIKACGDRMADPKWWEPLRLWAALVEGDNPDRLEPVLEALLEDREMGFWLVGCMLADGLGRDAVFTSWVGRLAAGLGDGWNDTVERCALAWAGSRQEERRRAGEAAMTGALAQPGGDRDALLRWQQRASGYALATASGRNAV